MQALVVDDSRAMRAILTRLMTGLVDWNMPVMDGLTFVKACRAREDFRAITLMMVTTETSRPQIVRALAAGAHEYVIKPFTDEVIAAKLDLLGLVAT